MAAPQTPVTGTQRVSPPNGVVDILQGPQTSTVQMASGTFVANGTTPVAVADTRVAATSIILISLNTVGGTVGAVPAVKTITAATGFTVAGTASDTSTYNYLLIG